MEAAWPGLGFLTRQLCLRRLSYHHTGQSHEPLATSPLKRSYRNRSRRTSRSNHGFQSAFLGISHIGLSSSRVLATVSPEQ